MDRDELLLEWYRNLHQERWERSRRTWTTISIFITGSFLLFLEAMKNTQLGRIPFIFLMIMAILLVAVSGVIEYSTIKFNESALENIKWIEKELNFQAPMIRYAREESRLWFKIRRGLWYVLFLFLVFLYGVAMIVFDPTDGFLEMSYPFQHPDIMAWALAFQIVGVTVIVIAQVVFYFRGRNEYGSIKPMMKAFIDLSCPQIGIEKERLKKLGKAKTEEKLRLRPLAQFLYDDFKVSLFGLILTLAGLIIETLVSLF